LHLMRRISTIAKGDKPTIALLAVSKAIREGAARVSCGVDERKLIELYGRRFEAEKLFPFII